MVTATPAAVAAALRADPQRTALFCDFDGALAAIVDDPAQARVVPGTGPVLEALVGTYGCVGVVSGRPLSFLETHLPPAVDLVGLYGLERRVGGHRSDHPQAGTWREVVADVTAAACHGPHGMRAESKGLSLTLHYREAPKLEAEVTAWAQAQAARSGLQARPAKMSVELHPPIPTDKGTVIAELSVGKTTVAYAGDDIGDVPAFDALDRMAAGGVAVHRLAVGGPELPPELADRADLVLDDPPALVALLASLL